MGCSTFGLFPFTAPELPLCLTLKIRGETAVILNVRSTSHFLDSHDIDEDHRQRIPQDRTTSPVSTITTLENSEHYTHQPSGLLRT